MRIRPFTFMLVVMAVAAIALSYVTSKAETYAERLEAHTETLEERVKKQEEALKALEESIEQ